MKNYEKYEKCIVLMKYFFIEQLCILIINHQKIRNKDGLFSTLYTSPLVVITQIKTYQKIQMNIFA